MRPIDGMNANERRIKKARWQERRNGKHGAELRKNIRHLGRSLLRAYNDDWIEKLRMLEGLGDQVANHPDFKELKRRIARMDEILKTFNDEELEIIELFHWGGMDYYEVAASLNMSNQTFYRHTWAIEETVGSKWQGL